MAAMQDDGAPPGGPARLSADGRIPATHAGSLPRPPALLAALRAARNGEPGARAAFAGRLRREVAAIVRRQVETGIDMVGDGELGKASYADYVTDRLSGFGGAARKRRSARDLQDYPRYGRRLVETGGTTPAVAVQACIGPVAPADGSPLAADLENFRLATAAAAPAAAFLTAASPGVIAIFLENQHYPTHDAYVAALAEAMRPEYEAIAAAGFVLQIDSPDLAMGRHLMFKDEDEAGFLRAAAMQAEAIDAATANIPPERMRLHLCWGNYQGPHHCDIPLERILDIAYRARPAMLSVEGANPRHEFEWAVFRERPLPDDKILIPGVVDSTSNFIEHPETVAQRLCRYANVVGRERVIAGTDCGFSTFAALPNVDPDIAWAKLGALAEGAARASDRLRPPPKRSPQTTRRYRGLPKSTRFPGAPAPSPARA